MSESAKTLADLAGLRVWLVHDWITGWRGGEKLLLEMVRMFPKARIATLVHVKGVTHKEIDARVERVSFLQKLPGVEKGYRNYLPLFPRAVRSLKLDGECDVVVSISHAVAKGVRVPRREGKLVPHVCYCNTPMRYIWDLEDQYVGRFSLKGFALGLVKPYLRRFDRRTDEVTKFIGNSGTIVERIERIYKREAVAVYPGVDDLFYVLRGRGDECGMRNAECGNGGAGREDFYLVVSALVPYKRVDLAVEAFRGIPQKKLVVIGKGPEGERLKALAGGAGNIEFMGWQSDEVARDFYQRCRGFLFPGLEDFGMTPVEAQLCGAPVVAYRAGGATETVVEGKTGVFFEEQTVAGLVGGIEKLEGMRFEESAARESGLRFTWGRFREGVGTVVREVLR